MRDGSPDSARESSPARAKGGTGEAVEGRHVEGRHVEGRYYCSLLYFRCSRYFM